jgi:hypothetical protein
MESTKQFRFIVLSNTEQSANEFAKWLTGTDLKDGVYTRKYKNTEFIGYCRWPGSGKPIGTGINDAILIRLGATDKWSELRDFVDKNSLINIKVLVSNNDMQSIVDEVKPTFCVNIAKKTNEEVLDELIKVEDAVDNLIDQVFKNFDKSGDGYINFNELEAICRELGYDVTHNEFMKTLRSLDINKDNRISYDEFKDWFKKGRQCTQLMDKLVSMRIATNNFFQSYLNTDYLNFIKTKVDYLNKVKKELITSFVSINIEKVRLNPDITVGIDGYFGGEVMETISKSYVDNFEEDLRHTDTFMIVEFTCKDPARYNENVKLLSKFIDSMRESFGAVSQKFFSSIGNDVSIKVIKKDSNTICLSLKFKREIKENILSFENSLFYLLDDQISQTINLSFCVSGNIDKVKSNPNGIFLDSFDPSGSLQLKAELLAKTIKLFTKYLKPIPRWLKFWINSYGGSSIDLQFGLGYLKSLNNSVLNEHNKDIINFIKTKINNTIDEFISPYYIGPLIKRFLESVKEDYSIVINTPQFHIVNRLDITGLMSLLNN